MKVFTEVALLNHQIQIMDLSEKEYVNVSTTNNWSKDDCIIINYLLDKDENLIHWEVLTDIKQQNYSIFPIDKDGKFTAVHMILPKMFEGYEPITNICYVYSASDSVIYKYNKTDNTTEKFTNLCDFIKDTYNYPYVDSYGFHYRITPKGKETINIAIDRQHEVFSTQYLYECYVNICKSLFNKVSDLCTSKCEKQNSKDSIWKRDFLWMTINVVNYYVELSQLDSAQDILDRVLNTCNGICKNSVNANDCGCGS